MKIKAVMIPLVFALTGTGLTQQGPVPKGLHPLHHVFVLFMQHPGLSETLNNPNDPFINQYAPQATLATNYFAVAPPSLTNYLEIVGGSNFGVLSDNSPDWHNASCTTNLASGVPNTDTPPSPAICPISGSGTVRA